MSAPLYLLDTGILLALVRGGQLGKHVERTYQLKSQNQRPLASIVSKAEIRVLAASRDWGGTKKDALENLLANVVLVDVNSDEVIDAYVEVDLFSRQWGAGPIKMGKNDLWVAATAKVTRARLLTTDKDFDHLDGVLLTRDYFDPEGDYPE